MSATMSDMNGTNRTPQQRIKELEATNEKYIAEISRLEFKVGELGGELNRLHAEFALRKGVRSNASGLYRALDDAIIHQIDTRGYKRKPVQRKGATISAEVLESDNVDALRAAAQAYDVQSYFRAKAPRSGMRLHYLVVSKVYRLGRDAALATLKKTYRVARKVAL